MPISDSDNTVVIAFSKTKLLEIIGTIEDRIAAYYQNINIAKVDDATKSELGLNTKDKEHE